MSCRCYDMVSLHRIISAFTQEATDPGTPNSPTEIWIRGSQWGDQWTLYATYRTSRGCRMGGMTVNAELVFPVRQLFASETPNQPEATGDNRLTDADCRRAVPAF